MICINYNKCLNYIKTYQVKTIAVMEKVGRNLITNHIIWMRGRDVVISLQWGLLRPAHTYASRRVHIGNSSGHAAQRVAAKVSCFKMDRVVSLALLCEEAEN